MREEQRSLSLSGYQIQELLQKTFLTANMAKLDRYMCKVQRTTCQATLLLDNYRWDISMLTKQAGLR